MGSKRHEDEEISAKTRQVDVSTPQGRPVTEMVLSADAMDVAKSLTPGRDEGCQMKRLGGLGSR